MCAKYVSITLEIEWIRQKNHMKSAWHFLYFICPGFSSIYTLTPVKEQCRRTEFLVLNQESRILGHSSNPVCGFSVMEQVILCAVWPMENWLGSSMNQIEGWTTVRESYYRALEQGPLPTNDILSSWQNKYLCWKRDIAKHYHFRPWRLRSYPKPLAQRKSTQCLSGA